MKKSQIALVAVAGGVLVFLIKLFAYFVSNSVALLSDALESIVNILASCLLLFSIWVSSKPADDDHNYGHQKIEDLSCLIEGVFVVVAAILIINTAAGRLFTAVQPVQIDIAIIISVIATCINGGISWFLIRASKQTGSIAFEGDAKHLFSDVISTVGVWLGLIIVGVTGWSVVDPIMAFIVAALIIRMGAGLIFKSGSRLMDNSCKEEEKKIREVLNRHHFRFIDYHDVKTRRNGSLIFCEMHLSVDGKLSVTEAHELTDHLENELKEELPNTTLTIHIEPEKQSKSKKPKKTQTNQTT